jgi:hypothetical protein
MLEDQKRAKTKAPTLYRAEFWSGLSVLLSLISLALPWWGIDITVTAPITWGPFSGPLAQLPQVTFSLDRLDQSISGNFIFITSLVVLTSLLAGVGSYLKRWSILTVALLSSLVTDLFFVADIAYALSVECAQTNVAPTSCISGLVGQGYAGTQYASWGFQAGFFSFVASGILLLAALELLRWNESGGRIHPPSANPDFRSTKL